MRAVFRFGAIAGILLSHTFSHSSLTADEPSAAEYEQLCHIMGSEVLKRIAPPFPESRMAYYLEKEKHQAHAIPRGPDNIYFRWNKGKLTRWGMTFGGGSGANLTTLVRMLAKIYPQDIVGDADLQQLNVPGDFIVNVDAKPKQIIRRLGEILQEEMKVDLRLSLRTQKREVYVAGGQYQFEPIDKKRKRIEIYGEKLNRNPSVGGGGSGDFDQFLRWVGMWIERPIVSEVATPPKKSLSWHYNLDSPFTDEERRAAKDPERVLQRITEQTGIKFTKEKRTAQVLVIEENP